MAVLVKGKVDYFVLTGGIAYSKSFCEMVKDYAGFLGEFVVVPGETRCRPWPMAACVYSVERRPRIFMAERKLPTRAAILAAGCIMFLFTGTIYA